MARSRSDRPVLAALGLWIVDEAVFALGLVGVLVRTWPEPPWDGLLWGGIGLMVCFPVIFFPWSKTLFVAVDLSIRPPEPGDYEKPREPAARRRP